MREEEEVVNASIVIDDGVIKYIGEHYDSYSPFNSEIDISGNLIMPSFKNLHGHAPMVFARALTDGVPLESWLNDIIFPLEKHLTREMVYNFTKLAILEYLSSGITLSSEMYYYPDEIAKAALEYHFPMHLVIANKEYKPIIDNIDKVNKNRLITYTVGLHSVYTTDKKDINICKEYLSNHKEGLCVHASETEREVSNCEREHHGLTPIEYLDSVGLFNYGGIVYHANYVTRHDIEIMEMRNIIPVSCPGSNVKLASGICPVRELLDHHLKVCLGTDGAASNDSLDMFKEMQLVSALQKISHKDASIIKPMEVLSMATVNGSIALSALKSCYIEVGQNADLIEIDLNKPEMQPINNIPANLVFSGSKDIIKMTMIHGEILYRDGEFFVNDDINELYKKCQTLTDELKAKAML